MLDANPAKVVALPALVGARPEEETVPIGPTDVAVLEKPPFVALENPPFIAPEEPPFEALETPPFVAPEEPPFEALETPPFVAPEEPPFEVLETLPFVALEGPAVLELAPPLLAGPAGLEDDKAEDAGVEVETAGAVDVRGALVALGETLCGVADVVTSGTAVTVVLTVAVALEGRLLQ